MQRLLAAAAGSSFRPRGSGAGASRDGRAARAVRAVLFAAFALLLAACSTSETLRTAVPAPVPTSTSPRYAAIVIDGHTGRVLHAANADQPRFPASLTKMMTLYMLFEAMERGQVTRDTQIPFSAYAAARPPSKLGFRPGQTIDVDTAIRALATKSANDVATAVAEYLGGSESRFAAAMTARAREIGMTSTVFRNPHGLPDPDQITTARDMGVLSVVLRRRFPNQYGYFGAQSFAFRGGTVRGHNRVLETVRGADGIKTGYTRASGFNLATSVTRDGRRLVAVVMGEDTAAKRNAHMEDLVERFLPVATRR